MGTNGCKSDANVAHRFRKNNEKVGRRKRRRMRFSLDKSFGIADVIARFFDIDFSDGAAVSGVMARGVMVSLSNHMIAAVVSSLFDPSTRSVQAELRAKFIPEVS